MRLRTRRFGLTGPQPSGRLRLSGGQRTDNEVEHISWDEWFRNFERAELALVYEATKSDAGRTFAKVVPAPDF
ncbi:hypothetical protein [Gordonia terrae]|uniref:Uncharacterized protein n=1 Tax=Gordonia terrae TaxID=2055 RepID=A0AAD0KCM0_9ACTN|nr:hypothetical protein [Gordonia terrae]ANY25188.1 hypothetical protein BCM27_22325 [Gordonia terrae]AWO85933.1 hypothetical protein DLJ61_22555 [Gordonia terrae]VTR08052.1 Uncharacterised protein [Clostridioides difficile]VTS62088.1 Uncharacterised protein [Gordonia terrae]